jgi:hypothetical protein
MSANANMFFNLVKTVEAASPALEHVHLSQGTRWYGNHLGPYKTPTKEDDPRHMPPNFYYDQQDFLEEFQKGKRWTWSVGRPHAVCGFSTGGSMNLTPAIAVYANVCKALGLPLSFPGQPGAYTALQGVEADTTDPIFHNIRWTNGCFWRKAAGRHIGSISTHFWTPPCGSRVIARSVAQNSQVGMVDLTLLTQWYRHQGHATFANAFHGLDGLFGNVLF